MRELSLKDVSKLCTNLHYSHGLQYVRASQLLTCWRQADSVGGHVRDRARIHTAQVKEVGDGNLETSCSCNVHQHQPFCQHVAAILIAWATEPERFKLYEGAPDEREVQPRRVSPADHHAALRTTLRRIETMLLDLLSHGLLTFGDSNLSVVREIAETARQHNLIRITAAVEIIAEELSTFLQLGRGAATPLTVPRRQFDEARYMEALVTAWRLTQAAMQAVDTSDMTRLHEMVGLPLREDTGDQRQTVKLVELAYCTSMVPYHDQAMENSYFLDLLSGRLMVERCLTPKKQRTHRSKRSYEGIWQADVVVAQGLDVDEIVAGLDGAAKMGGANTETWRYAAQQTVRNWAELHQRLLYAAAAQPGGRAIHVWVAPSRVIIDEDALYLLDENDKGVLAHPAQAIEWTVQHKPLVAVFGRLEAGERGLVCHVLSLLCGEQTLELTRLSN